MFSATLLALLAAPIALAAPHAFPAPPAPKVCSLANITPTLPTGLTLPTAPLSFVGLGFGVQNYTCGAAGTYTNVGAVAELIDMSCVKNIGTTDPAALAYKFWKNAPAAITTQEIITFMQSVPLQVEEVLGQHYFVPGATAGSVSPKWDFTSASQKGKPTAFVIAAKDLAVPAPNATADVPDLALHGVTGALATNVMRLSTHGGQPPASCTAGATLSVRYTSMYWLFGSTVA